MATITRSSVNSEQYAAPEHLTSGFDMSYTRHSSYALGRIHIGGFQYVMPGDKVSGSSKFNGTFNRIVTPMISPVRAMCYQVFLPFRAIDTTFMKGMTPTKLNEMSSNWNVPTVTTRQLVSSLFDSYGDYAKDDLDLLLEYLGDNEGDTLQQFLTFKTTTIQNFLYNSLTHGLIYEIIKSLESGSLFSQAQNLYLDDALLDIINNITAKLGSSDNPISSSITIEDFLYTLFDCILTPFVGRYSYYGELKYNYVRPKDLYMLLHDRGIADNFDGLSSFIDYFDDTPQSEYALRVMYAIWYEKFRNVDLEPVNDNLPDWREFGSTSIFDLDNGGNLIYLIWRIRSWEKDMFTTAQIDDLSRHVYAPVVSRESSMVAFHGEDVNNMDAQFNDGTSFAESDEKSSSRKPFIYTIGYYDNSTGDPRAVQIPVPSNVNDVLSAVDQNFQDVYGLDLNTLRQSQMLEKYLKRNYLFGDEYQDRLLAHYNSRLSDKRINRPEIIGQSISNIDMGQQVSNVSTEETKVGDRTATATVSLSGDGYTTYIEEFGIIITLITFMPRPMYDGLCPQLLLTKYDHFPLPEFATNNEEFGRIMEIASSGLVADANGNGSDTRYMFGRYPAYHAWRSRVDEVGGMFLNELQDSTFRRFWGLNSESSTPALNYQFIHCRPNLGMFANTILYDTQIYGDLINECFVERVLPNPVETI